MYRYCFAFQIQKHIDEVGNDKPFLLLGGAGSGKSSLMAKVADVTNERVLQGRIPGYVPITKLLQLSQTLSLLFFGI